MSESKDKQSAETTGEEEEGKEALNFDGVSKWAWLQGKPEIPLLIVGVLGSVIVGTTWPINSIIMSKAIGVILEVGCTIV